MSRRQSSAVAIVGRLGIEYSGFPCGGFYPTINGQIIRHGKPYGIMPKRYRTPEAAFKAAEQAFKRGHYEP